MAEPWQWLAAGCAALVIVLSAHGQSQSGGGGGAGRAPRPDGARRSPALPGVKVHGNVEYAKVGDKSLLLDLYLPDTPPPSPSAPTPLPGAPPPDRAKTVPLIVWVHGGAWRAGSKADCPARFLVPRGYAVASIGYRLSGEATFPAQIHDCKAAIRFLRANAAKYAIDPNRIGAWGASAGGHLAALLGTSGGVKDIEGDVGGNLDQSSKVQAACDWFGPTDFLAMIGQRSGIVHESAGSPESLLVGGPIEQHKDLCVAANPITYVDKDDPPFLIMHGDRDDAVPFNQSQLLYEALKKAGVDATFHPVKGAGHGLGGAKDDPLPKLYEMVAEFFDKHLKARGGAQ